MYIAALEYVEHENVYSFTAKMIMPHKQKNIDMQNIDIYSRWIDIIFVIFFSFRHNHLLMIHFRILRSSSSILSSRACLYVLRSCFGVVYKGIINLCKLKITGLFGFEKRCQLSPHNFARIIIHHKRWNRLAFWNYYIDMR